MDFEWDRAKSERNESERGLPFELAALLFDGPTIESSMNDGSMARPVFGLSVSSGI
jgi:uncharacterized DUF497 family protein